MIPKKQKGVSKMEMETATVLYLVCILLGAIGGFGAGYGIGFLMHAAGKNTTLWGQKLAPIPAVGKGRVIGAASWGVIILSLGLWMYTYLAVDDPWGGDSPAIWVMLYIALAMLVACIVGNIVGNRSLKKALMNSKNALPLGELPLLQEIDARISGAKTVAIFADGIALFDEQKHAFFSVPYANHSLATLTDSAQIKLLGYYFRQKYGNQFRYKPTVDATYIGDRVIIANVSSILFMRQKNG